MPNDTLRIAVGGLSHETNTYADDILGLTQRQAFMTALGEDVIANNKGTRTYIGGMLDAADEIGAEVVPLAGFLAGPSGTIARAAYDEMKTEILDRLSAALPVDAVSLELHGAGVVEGIDDLEADLGAAVRAIVGPDVPLVCALDLHGNITDEMAEVFDAMFGVHLYPHTDTWERGHEAVSILPRLVGGEVRPTTHVEHVPILLPTSTTDPGHPAADMNEVCREIESRPGVIDCTVFHGFPFTDVPGVGVHVVTTTEGDADAARAAGAEVGRWIWSNRKRFIAESHAPESAVRTALATERGPVVINETSDNPGGGSPGDGTHLLRALVDAEVDNAAFAAVTDPDVVQAAIRAGVGATIECELGGKHGDLHGAPVAIKGVVKCITDGRYRLQALMQGLELRLGPSCRIDVGGLAIVVISVPSQTFDPELFLMHGIDVMSRHVVALKSSNHFRAGFRDIASVILTADSPGLTTNRVEVFDHTRAERSLWPTDPATTYGLAP